MRRMLALTILGAVLAPLVSGAGAQDVRNTSYVIRTRGRVLRIETVVPASPETVSNAWTKPQELCKWIAPVVNLNDKLPKSTRDEVHIPGHVDRDSGAM